MFDKLKQLSQIREMQKIMEQEEVAVEKQGVKVVLKGTMEVKEIQLNAVLSKEDQEKILKECLNEAQRKLQTSLAGKMMAGGGFGM